MKKRITALLLCCVMLLTLCPGLISTATAYDDTQPDQAEATGETVQPTVNFTNVAPFLPPVSGGVRILRAPLAAANYAANDAANFAATDNGMKISKTATRNADGSYTITLEAYATGSKVITEQKTDIPTDIILVLDQSGSMADDIGQVQYTAYTGNNTQNKSNYEKRHNGGSANLWHQLPDGSYVSVSVTLQQTITYNKITKGRNDNGSSGYTNYWENRNNLYTYVNGEIKKVVYTRERDWLWENWNCKYALEDGTILNQNNEGSHYSPTFQNTDDGYLYLRVLNENQNVYTYTYTDTNGTTQTIGTSTGASTRYTPAFYQRSTTTSGGGSRLNALKSAANAFASAVATKAAGEDGDITTTADNIDHRIAVVGYADTDWDYGYNTGVFIGSTLNRYENNAAGVYSTALQDMSTTNGKSNVAASLNALQASGATRTDYGLIMAKGILDANPVPTGETRNRVVIVFTDGSPTNSNGFQREVANSAILTANAIKDEGTTVYSIGIFSGADASTAGKEPDEDYYDSIWGSNYTDAQMSAACNWFMQKVSSNNGTPRTPSYYLSAGDSASLNNIFQQISDQIETGGTSSTLTADAVVKDIISPQFTLPAGTQTDDITLETYKYQGPSFAADNAWVNNNDAMGAKATVNGDTVSVTGFDFAANYVGTVTENGNVSYRGNKLVIKFTVEPRDGFLGGNDVTTNASAGIYENSSAQTPVRTFDQPEVNVPIKDVTVTAKDKNVYLLGGLTAAQLKEGAMVKVGDVTLNLAPDATNYGLEAWQTEYVNITVTVKDKDGNVITTDLTDLTDDTTYTVEVTVAPKTQGTSTPEKGEAATAKTGVNAPAANIYVFNPEVNFKDSTIYRGNTADYSNNQTDTPVWKHGNKVDTAVDMIGTAPTLTYSYDKGEDAFEDCTNVNVTVKIGSTNVTDKTTGDKLFTVHVLQPVITATVNDVERYYGESYTLGDGANGAIDLTWTDNHNHSAIPPVTGDMPYDANDLSLAYSTTAFSGQTGTVPASDFDVTVKVMKGDTEMPDATITTSCTLNKDCKTPDNDGVYTVHVKTCTLTIVKSGCSDLDYHAANNTGNAEYQSFIFEVNGDEDNNVQIAPIKVTVQGNGEVKIVGLPTGTYTVTEDGHWSWRYKADGPGKVTLSAAKHDAEVLITNTRNANKWLSGDSYAVNYVGCSKARGTFVAGN